MLQVHKSITLTPFHPTNGGMNAYKNYPSGRRVVLSNDNRFTPIASPQNGGDWDPFYGLTSHVFTESEKNGVPGVFGESFNIDNIPTQIITNGVVDMPTDRYFAVPENAGIWKPGSILVLVPNKLGGWLIGKIDPVAGATPEATVEYKYSNQQIGVLLEPLEWIGQASSLRAKNPTVSVLVGYSKIPKRLTVPTAVKAAPLATPKVATK